MLTLSIASLKSSIVTFFRLFLTARSAASFTTFAKSAPAKPVVPCAIDSKSTSESSLTFFE